MDSEEKLQLQQNLTKYLLEIAADWCRVVAGPGSDPDHSLELYAHLVRLTGQILNLVSQETFDAGQMQQIGAELSQLGNRQPEVLTCSQAVFAAYFQRDLPVNLLQSRVALVLGYLALGYFNQPAEKPPLNPPAESAHLPVGPQLIDLALVNQQLRQEVAQQKQVEADLRQQNRDLEVVNRASQAFYSTLELDQVLSTILDELHRVMAVFAFSVWLVDPATNEVVCYRTTEAHTAVMFGWRLALGQGVVGQVAQSGQSMVVADTRADPKHYKKIDELLGIEIRSIISVPLRGRETVIGVIQVVDTTPQRFSPADQVLLESLAEAAGMAIENARLFEDSRRNVEAKSMLLREVNHRIKNNLAVISSILHLKRHRLNADNAVGAQTITEDVMSYIHGLATVHNLLSTSNWTPLPFSDLVTKVIDTTLQVLAPERLVSVRVTPADIWVTASQAHDLALVINELITNAVKHAVPQGTGMFSIEATVSTHNQTAHFELKDNGPGFPAKVLALEPGHYNLGFELIKHIVQNSLEGKISLHNEHGAVIVVEFPLEIGYNK